MSQWGAQGWAEGATGVKLTGEQIVAKYFLGAQLATQPITLPFRVLLSAPSTGCVARTIDDVAHMRSARGMRLVNNADPGVVSLDAVPDQSVRFSVYQGTELVAVDEWSGRIVYSGETDTLMLVPKQFWDPVSIAEKGFTHRGNIAVKPRRRRSAAGRELRVVGRLHGGRAPWRDAETVGDRGAARARDHGADLRCLTSGHRGRPDLGCPRRHR